MYNHKNIQNVYGALVTYSSGHNVVIDFQKAREYFNGLSSMDRMLCFLRHILLFERFESVQCILKLRQIFTCQVKLETRMSIFNSILFPNFIKHHTIKSYLIKLSQLPISFLDYF